MGTKRPLSTIATGKPGRPAGTRQAAARRLAEFLLAQLVAEGLVPAAVPIVSMRATLLRISNDGIRMLAEYRDLHVVPGGILRELALIVGEAAPAEPTPPETETPPPVSDDNSQP